MRSKLGAALAGLTVVAGGAMIAGSATAQTYYYNPPPVTYYTPPPASGYYVAPAPGYVYDPDDNPAAVAGAVIGSVIGTMPAYGPAVPVDRYGPDPNGMIAPDGHRIKCKLRSDYDGGYGHYMTRRVCW